MDPTLSEFFIGIDPTINLSKWGLPLTLKAPTYVTVGPANFWVNGAGNALGVASSCGPGCKTTIAEDGNLGVFTTGLTAIWDLGKWIPANYGGWYVLGRLPVV